MNRITPYVKYLNEHYTDDDVLVISWLDEYIHSSCSYRKQNIDKSWLIVQPAWSDKIVVGYKYYSDKSMDYNHHTNRFILYFDDNTTYDISVYKFKRFLKRLLKKQRQLRK